MVQVWLSYASFEATPASMLGQEQEGDASEAERKQAAGEQEGSAAAADREAHARRSASDTLFLNLGCSKKCVCFKSIPY